jgi:hypothetical protein
MEPTFTIITRFEQPNERLLALTFKKKKDQPSLFNGGRKISSKE